MTEREKPDSAEMEASLKLAYAIASNAIYAGDSDEYRTALYGVCNAIIEDDDDWETKHGTRYISDTSEVDL